MGDELGTYEDEPSNFIVEKEDSETIEALWIEAERIEAENEQT